MLFFFGLKAVILYFIRSKKLFIDYLIPADYVCQPNYITFAALNKKIL